MHIPAVTEEDLHSFHRQHFPSAPAPQKFFYGHNSTGDAENSLEDQEYEDELDDGLGYYPDGVKRTLTDEQIAIFRHSEIQKILKEQRFRDEAQESEQVNSRQEKQATTTPAVLDGKADAAPIKTRTRPSKREQKRRQKARRAEEARKLEVDRKNHPRVGNAKRKRNGPDEESLRWSEDEDGHTKRRKAREADNCDNFVVNMDY